MLSCLRMFALMSDAVYRSRHSAFVEQLLGLDPSIPVRIHFKGRSSLTHIYNSCAAAVKPKMTDFVSSLSCITLIEVTINQWCDNTSLLVAFL